jgi:hypothetical protein
MGKRRYRAAPAVQLHRPGVTGLVDRCPDQKARARKLTKGQVLFATGDIVAQQLIEKKGKEHDLSRTG